MLFNHFGKDILELFQGLVALFIGYLSLRARNIPSDIVDEKIKICYK